MKKLREAAARARRRTQTLEGMQADVDDLTARFRQALREQSREFITTPIPRRDTSEYADGHRFPADLVYLRFGITDLPIGDYQLQADSGRPQAPATAPVPRTRRRRHRP